MSNETNSNDFKPFVPFESHMSYRTSKFKGVCRWCGSSYKPFDQVNWNPKQKGTVCHAGCYATYGSPTPKVWDRETKTFQTVPTNHQDAATTATSFTTEDGNTFTFANGTVKGDEVKTTPVTATPVNGGLGATLADAIFPYLEGRLQQTVNRDEVRDMVKTYVDSTFDGMIFKTVNTVEIKTPDNSEPRDMGVQHKSFKDLLVACSARESDGYGVNIWLVGPAGTGKTTAAKNVSKALGLAFYTNGAISSEFQLMGFIDAGGNLHKTPFRNAWENGGVYLFDEVDGSSVPATLPFNAALANGVCAFPDGMIPRHKDCIIIAAANTWGLGATIEFVGRNKMDAAFLDRFVQLEWTIDEALEIATSGNPQWTARVQVWRKRAQDKGIKTMITPRASYKGTALLAAGMAEDTVIKMTVRKAMRESDWLSIA